jgi:hypothetical protein
VRGFGEELPSLFCGAGRRIVAVIHAHAFLDESGTNPETPVLSVAGFYGDENQWSNYRSAWLPHSRAFHAKNCARLFPQLFVAIEASKVTGILTTIGKKTYEQHATAHLKTAVGNPYSLSAFLCVMAICREVGDRSVSFVLEEGQPNVSWVKHILEAMMNDEGSCVAAVATAKKTDFIELHAADFVSHIASAHEKEWLQKLFDAGRLKMGHVTEKMIRDAAPQVRELFRLARHFRNKAKEEG